MTRSNILTIFFFFVMAYCLYGQNIPRANYTGPYGAQVNTYNGNLYLERTDVVIPNQDLPIGLTFSYNSFRDSTDTGYGFGWSHSYALRCVPYEGGAVIIRTHGRRDSFMFSNEQYLGPPGIFDELSETSGGIFELRDKYGMVYRFAEPAHHYVTQVENTNDNQLQLTYTDSLLISISDGASRTLELSYTDGRLSAVNDNNFPGGRAWSFDYTGGNQLECVANPFGDCKSYAYDEKGRMISYQDERGYELGIRYDENNRISLLQSCVLKVGFAYNTEQFRTTVTEQNEGADQITTFVYNEEGKLIRKTGNCCGYDMSYSYDSDNNLSEVTDANGNNRQATYDALGNTVATQDALAQSQQMDFGVMSRLQSVTDKRGNTTAFDYDDNGNLNSIQQPLGVGMNFTYDAAGNASTVTDGEGNISEMSYNSNNDLTEVRYEIGTEQYVYDNAGNLSATTDANGNTISMSYDALNRLKTIEDALNNRISYDYDAASNLTQETDPEGNEKSYDYDGHDRLISVTTPIGETRYGYDALDNLTSITNAEEHTTSFAYDTRSRLINEQDAMGFTTQYEYDNNGNVISSLDAKNQQTYYRYDALNRLVQRTYSGNTDNFSYDANGNLLRAGNNHISYVYVYDALNRLTSKTDETKGLTILYEYDQVSNRTKMTDPSGGETAYSYDANNRLTALTNPANETTEFVYDTGGRLVEQRNHNGTYTTYVYDVANRLTSLYNYQANGSALAGYNYSYDRNGLRTSMTDHNGGTASYIYDGENRLTQVTYVDGSTEVYTFDNAGNRISLNKDGETITYTYDAADRIQNAGATTYDFDGNGNMIRKTDSEGSTLYSYNGENQLVRADLPDGTIVYYQYDPFGNRVKTEHEASIIHYFLDGENVLLELDENNSPQARYTSGLALDSWISIEREGNSYVYHTDALGSTIGLTNANQELVNTYKYDAYGNITTQEEGVENNYRYTGREWDEHLRLNYHRLRYYDITAGRFVNKDEYRGNEVTPSSLNRYLYVNNTPISYNDPTGKFAFLAPLIPLITKELIKGVIKAVAFGLAVEGGKKIYSGQSLKCIDYGDVAVSAGLAFFPIISMGKIARGGAAALNQYVGRGTKSKILNGINNFGKKKFPSNPPAANSKFFQENIRRGIKQDIALGSAGALAGLAGKKAINWNSDDCNPSTGDQSAKNNESEIPDNPPPGEVPPLPCDICIPIEESFDPNEIIGPPGVGQDQWVKQESTLPYTILFENDPDFATAAAQRVRIIHTFDDSVNPVSFRLGDFGFGSYYFQVPSDVSYYDTRIDLTDSLGIFLDVIASINQEQGQAFWVFESIDPATGLAQTLPAQLGFLPVNDSLTRAGEGFVNFSIRPTTTAETGDRIEAQADIIFDNNPAIATNIAINTIDGDAPESSITAPIDTLPNNSYRLRWEGTDVGAGLANYTLYVSTNDGLFTAATNPLNLTFEDYVFSGMADSTYRFFTLAQDSVGNIEPFKNVGEPSCMDVSVDSLVNANAGQNNGLIRLLVEGNTGPVSFHWSHDPDLNAATATNLVSGLYEVTVSDTAGCVVSLSQLVDVINNVSPVQEDILIYQIFPVPAEYAVNVSFYTEDKSVLMTIIDAQGKLVNRQQFATIPSEVNRLTVEVKELPAGNYFLRLETATSLVSGLFNKI